MNTLYGWENFKKYKSTIIRQGLQLVATLGLFSILNNHLSVINKKLILTGQQTMSSLKARNYVQQELLSIFEKLEEAIITIGNKSIPGTESITQTISYTNNKFHQIIKKMKGINSNLLLTEQQDSLMDLRIFKVSRYSEHPNGDISKQSKSEGKDLGAIGQTFSIRQIMTMTEEFLSSRVFSTEYDHRKKS